jgi:hypothetical protein
MGKHGTEYTRIDRDLYPTPYWVIAALAEHLDLTGMTVWECACGDGRMRAALLQAHCERVYCTDIVHRGGRTGRSARLSVGAVTAAAALRCDRYQAVTMTAHWFTTNKTGFKGVYYSPRRSGIYRAEIKLSDGRGGLKWRRSKWFHTAIEAAQAYDELALQVFGPAAPINFPLNGERQVKRVERKSHSCFLGHPLSLTPDGDWTCRKCDCRRSAKYAKKRRETGEQR